MQNATSHLPVNPEESIHVPHVHCAYGECPCDFSRHCSIWMEFQIAMVSLHDSEDLMQGNWAEITRLRTYVDYLEKLLDNHRISHLDEYDLD